MGWFGGGSSSEDTSTPVSDFSSSDESSFSSPIPSQSSVQSAGMGASSLQSFAAEMQQKALVQGVVSKLTQIAFEKCISKPDSALSGSEIKCVHAVTGKYMDGSEFVLGRFQKQQQKQNIL
ncbi:hypothetical protein TrVE_jg9107 [Triparma verrucosa]|uniref:Mitochondrial import inner membrane translocase subunit n=2 Tax=Triparma TaxID=722752 RepID=A0A9W7AN97_9STRA|nr:hypothetical protein TrST_g10213 [Triparma strigata]GMH86240.1 hypothetical protein TrVE_jg9107 [Triparma verrucosa]